MGTNALIIEAHIQLQFGIKAILLMLDIMISLKSMQIV